MLIATYVIFCIIFYYFFVSLSYIIFKKFSNNDITYSACFKTISLYKYSIPLIVLFQIYCLLLNKIHYHSLTINSITYKTDFVSIFALVDLTSMQNLFFSDPYPSTRRAPEEAQLKNISQCFERWSVVTLYSNGDFRIFASG
jgi:hypothetical protein